jgi:hypothetical protein
MDELTQMPGNIGRSQDNSTGDCVAYEARVLEVFEQAQGKLQRVACYTASGIILLVTGRKIIRRISVLLELLDRGMPIFIYRSDGDDSGNQKEFYSDPYSLPILGPSRLSL